MRKTLDDAKTQCEELADVVGQRRPVPLPATDVQGLIRAIIPRARVAISLPDVAVPAAGWSRALFTDDAIKVLAGRCRQFSVRRAINDVRDLFDLRAP